MFAPRNASAAPAATIGSAVEPGEPPVLTAEVKSVVLRLDTADTGVGFAVAVAVVPVEAEVASAEAAGAVLYTIEV